MYDEPAFPRGTHMNDPDDHMPTDGMSLRDYFAAKAMAVYMIDPDLAQISRDMNLDRDEEQESFAELAYNQADAMLKQRSKT